MQKRKYSNKSVKYLVMSLQTELFKLLFGEYDWSSFDSSLNELSCMVTRLFLVQKYQNSFPTVV